MNEPTQQAQPQQDADAPHAFAIQRVYIKNLSFKAPSSPAVFQQEWKPDLNLQLNITTVPLTKNVYDVILKVIATITCAGKEAFSIEVQQAGIFTLPAFEEKELQATLNTLCPAILYPYAREVITDLATRGTFPPLYLAPVNFDALYAQQLKKEKGDGQTPPASEIITH